MNTIDQELEPLAALRNAVSSQDADAVEAIIEPISPADAARLQLQLSESDRADLLKLVDAETAAWLLDTLPDEAAAAVIESLQADEAASIVEELDSDDQADVLAELSEADAEAILQELKPEAADEIRSLMEYPEDQAGGLMITEVFKFEVDQTVGAVLQKFISEDEGIERYRGQHPYIVNDEGQLVGVVSLRNLLSTRRHVFLRDVMVPPISVSPSTPLEKLRDILDEYPFLGIPVVDENDILLGVVPRDSVSEAELERAEGEIQKLQGLVIEEFRSMPTRLRARRRLSWLTINIVLNIIAASVIALYEETLSAVIALAVFLPIVSDMSGCSGNQAVAVSLRELSLGLIKPADVFRVWFKEASVGLINGVVLGILIALTAWGWKGNPYIGLVVGLALAINTFVAVSIGGTVPLLLKRFNVDPAVASGPMLTTITDMCGFFFVLSFATIMLPILK